MCVNSIFLVFLESLATLSQLDVIGYLNKSDWTLSKGIRNLY